MTDTHAEVGDDYINRKKLIPTPYKEDVAKKLKDNIRSVWLRKKETENVRQVDLADKLQLSQGAVSKLLSDGNSHYWTIDKVSIFIKEFNVDPKEVFKDIDGLSDFFGTSSEKDGPSRELLDECYRMIADLYAKRGRTIPDDRLLKLAGRVAVRVQKTDRKIEDFYEAINDVLLDAASGK